jgi:hypothetical protein
MSIEFQSNFHVDDEHPDLYLDLGSPIQLEGFSALLETRLFTDLSGTPAPLHLQEPYYFLGSGGEKLVISATCPELNRFARSAKTTKIAVGIGIQAQQLTTFTGWQLARRLGLPTYEWVLPSIKKEIILMPDISEGRPVHGEGTKEAFSRYRRAIRKQLQAIVDKASQKDGAKIYTDSYFLDLRTGRPKVILGDLDHGSPEHVLCNTEEDIRALQTFNQGTIKTILDLGYFW